MPDEDKFKKLREVGYSIGGHCDFCKHSDFCSGQLWGKCGLHTYAHGKHTGDLRGAFPSFGSAPVRSSRRTPPSSHGSVWGLTQSSCRVELPKSFRPPRARSRSEEVDERERTAVLGVGCPYRG